MRRSTVCLVLVCSLAAGTLHAGVSVHNAFDNNMVVQRDKRVRVWGRADAGEAVTVTFRGQAKDARADRKGNWSIVLDPLEASSTPGNLVITGAANTITYENVLVGDVWLCGGQSNMEHELRTIYHGDVEMASAHYPCIRLMTVPQAASREPLSNIRRLNEYSAWSNRYKIKGSWIICSPEAVRHFSGMGYIFGRRLHMVSRIPIGIIDMSRGGTTVESWTSRRTLAAIPEAGELLSEWDGKRSKALDSFNPDKDLEARIRVWTRESELRKRLKMDPTPKPTELRSGPEVNRNEPGASFNGMVAPLKGLAARGIIFNHGHNNAGGDCRPTLYARALKGMIGDWREVFGAEDLPFGIIAFVSGGRAQTFDNFELRMLDGAPYVREAQFAAYKKLANMGYTASYDEQMVWYHTFSKILSAERMARWALGTQYGVRLGYEPARLASSEKRGDRYLLTFDRPLATLYQTARPIEGMAVAGEDRHFYPARARFAVKGKDRHNREILDRRRLEVWSDIVKDPVAVRYAWARNPLGNLGNWEHMERMIPVPTFRTDTWPIPFGPEADAMKSDEFRNQSRKLRHHLNKRAEEQIRKRKREEAELLYRSTRQ